MRRIYLDHNATTGVHPLVAQAMQPFLHSEFGNPSSIHRVGRSIKKIIENVREQVAGLVNCEPEEVVFTSCATEANNTAIKGVAVSKRMKGKHIVTTAVEHPSVLMPCYFLEHFGFAVDCCHVDQAGRLDIKDIEGALTEETILLSVMYANNETGTIFPVQEIGELAALRGVCFHCDAAQAVGKIPVDFKACNCDLMSFSGHKFYAPKGVGALIVRQGIKLPPLLHGGSQERNRRAGTENVAGIVGLGKACEIAASTQSAEAARLLKLRDRLEQTILAKIPNVRVNGNLDHRLPNTSNLSFLHVDSDSLLSALDQAGIAVSSVSACSSGTLKTSRVLKAMGVADDTRMGTIRFSLGRSNDEEDVSYVLEVMPGVVERVRQVVNS